jgi:hypothetical protein
MIVTHDRQNIFIIQATGGLFYKCFIVVIYDCKLRFSLVRNLQLSFTILSKASLSCDHSFIVLATVIIIVNYYCKTFIEQATKANTMKRFTATFFTTKWLKSIFKTATLV